MAVGMIAVAVATDMLVAAAGMLAAVAGMAAAVLVMGTVDYAVPGAESRRTWHPAPVGTEGHQRDEVRKDFVVARMLRDLSHQGVTRKRLRWVDRDLAYGGLVMKVVAVQRSTMVQPRSYSGD
jgi:hypothetical protein